jgi:AraC-like DNA-binding protein
MTRMGLIRFTAPPLPHYIMNGFTTMPPGEKHVNRRSIGAFDLLVVTKGCLYIGEEDRHYELTPGHALLLRPDCHHYPLKGNTEATDHYWLHFHTQGTWSVLEQDEPPAHCGTPPACRDGFSAQVFSITVPQYTKLREPELFYENLDRLIQLDTHIHLNSDTAAYEQQQLFLQVLRQLSAAREPEASTPSKLCAQKAASYLRSHYKHEVSAQELGDMLNFHPVYIARCMQKEFGCSPFEYLARFRIEQAKLLMVRTDLSIARIAEEVGFQNAAYFSTCFNRYEGTTPRSYRRRFT